MYNAEKRHDRYLKNQETEKVRARERYNSDPVAINARRRELYSNNIEINRKKLRERQARRRANIRMCQNDTQTEKNTEKTGHSDTSV